MPSQYPRKPNSDTIVHEKDWGQGSPFGHCPACGSIGIEEIHISGDPVICFYCSDITCKTIMGSRSPARTKWNIDKPNEVLIKEKRGWSWNEEHFPGQNMSDICLD